MSEALNPEARKLWWIALVVNAGLGITNGLYLYTYGAYFYEKFGSTVSPTAAMFLTTVLLMVRQGLVALLEVPTGALADVIGRVNVVIFSWIARIVFFISLAAIWFCSSITLAFLWSILASIAFAFSYTLFNGAFSAWCVDTIKEKKLKLTYSWLVARFYSYRSMSEIIGGFIAIVCYLKGVPFLGFILAALLAFGAMGFCMNKMKEKKRSRYATYSVGQRMRGVISRGAQACARTPVLFWIVVMYGSYMFLLNVVVYLWPVYLKTTFGGNAAFGRTWILMVVGAQFLTMLSARFLVWLNMKNLEGFRRVFVSFSLLSAALILALSWNTAQHTGGPFLFPVSVIVVLFSFGMIGPCFETLINAYIPPEDAGERATIMSAGSMFRSLLVFVLAIPSGGSSGETSPISWAIPATALLLATLIANSFMRRAAKEKEQAPEKVFAAALVAKG